MPHRRDAAALDALQARLGHFFADPTLLQRALTHPTAALEAGWTAEASYERFEFLGDALLNAWVAEFLFDRFPHEPEGILTKLRAYWVSGATLAEVSRQLKLPQCLAVGEGGARDRVADQPRVQASVLEAVVAAVHLDAGPAKAAALVRRLWRDPIVKRGLVVLSEDAKTTLQEHRQARGLPLPVYRCDPEGDQFRATVRLDGRAAGEGLGASKKAAEQAAARQALAALAEQAPPPTSREPKKRAPRSGPSRDTRRQL